MLGTALEHIDDLADFVSVSPTSYHAADQIAVRLRLAGFEEVDPTRPFGDVTGRRFVLREGAVIAWVAPGDGQRRDGLPHCRHPHRFPRLQGQASRLLRSAGWTGIGVEIYGGPLINSWLDRDLGLAGRIVTRDGLGAPRADGPDRAHSAARHPSRPQRQRRSEARPPGPHAADRRPRPRQPLLETLCALAGVAVADAVATDLFTFDTQRPSVIGVEREFFASARLDNLLSTHAALTAMESLTATDDVAVFAAFDHEEVGSATATGAAGPILGDVLERIAAGYGLGLDETRAMYARSSCVSADCGHVVHPNYAGKHGSRTSRPQQVHY